MTIPNQVKLGGLILKVELVDNLASNRDRFGEFSPLEQVIRIDRILPEDKREETLLHEIIEALNCYYYLDMPHHAIQALSVGLHQAIKDNKLHF